MSRREPIAIVGIGGVFPGRSSSEGLNGFWADIVEGCDVGREPAPGRWALGLDQAFHSQRGRADRVYSRRACFVDDFEIPEAALHIDAASLVRLDPVVRMAVRAGVDAWGETRHGSLDFGRVGVILGNIALPTDANAEMADWALGRRFRDRLFESYGAQTPADSGNCVDPVHRHAIGLPAAILARAFGFGGTSFGLDAACASSLFAIELAMDELHRGRLDAVMCGGLARPDGLYTQMGFSQLGALSERGHCAPFDHRADGIVVGEGAGVLVLKRLSTALAHGDRVRALVRAVGTANDVDGKLLAPSREGQLRAMRAAYARAGWAPSSVDLIECHATGTPIGDATEYGSLCELWRGEARRERRTVLGSVKSNVGHLLTGAGAAGLIKVVLAIEARVLPPTANFERAARGIDLDAGPFEVLQRARPWEARAGGRRAAVSGFGFGGTNAHLLVEEYVDGQGDEPVLVAVPRTAEPGIAVVGIAGRVGPWGSMGSLGPRLLGVGADHLGRAHKLNDWGAGASPPGYFVEEVEIEPGRFRIPPKELAAALPQQSIMLDVAQRALADAQLEAIDPLRTGVYVGIALDANTTNFRLRWVVRAQAPAWARALGLPDEGPEFESWVDSLCDRASPPLDADRTMGGLGAITASRIAREFGFGGPSFVLASGDQAGFVALEAATRALQAGRIDAALVGAVDLCADPRVRAAARCAREEAPDGVARPFDLDGEGIVTGEGAVALVLTREVGGERELRRSYAILRGVAAATGEARSGTPDVAAQRRSLARALEEAGLDLADFRYIESHGSGDLHEDRVEAEFLASQAATRPGQVVGSAKADVGHTGAAASLVSLLKAICCVHHRVLPRMRGTRTPRPELAAYELPAASRPWLRDAADLPRRALVTAMSGLGQVGHVVVEEGHRDPVAGLSMVEACGLFVIEGDSVEELQGGLDSLRTWSAGRYEGAIDRVAASWASVHGRREQARLAVAIVAGVGDDLQRLIDLAARGLREGLSLETLAVGRLFHRVDPLGSAAPIAFVYPGSGAHFPGMGRDLALAWPGLLRAREGECETLRSQFDPDRIWGQSASPVESDAKALMLAQVALGTLVTDVVSQFGVRPSAVIGYSLGETAGLFATGAWRDRDEMVRRMHASPLFTTELTGPCHAARRRWGFVNGHGHATVRWRVGVIDRPLEEVRGALFGIDRAYLLIVNTPHECVIGGDASAVDTLVARMSCNFHPLDGVTTVHCEVAEEVEAAYREFHLLSTFDREGVRYYSGHSGHVYPLSRESAAGSIVAQAIHGFDFTQLIANAHADGIRVFIEMGPGGSCTRMIREILGDREGEQRYVARALCVAGQDGPLATLRLLGALIAERVPVDLSPLHSRGEAEPAPSRRKIAVGVGAPPDWPRLAGLAAPVAPRPTEYRDTLEAAVEPTRAGFLDRRGCLEFALGKVGEVLGATHAPADAFPTRVRLPAEPLMLVDRIVSVEGEPLSMTCGRVVTEHDVREGAWYLDGGRIPTCIAVEAGQADLFMASYLGIDLHTRGKAVYRLLDATVTFHDRLPGPGAVIRYDIHVDGFTQHAHNWLFRFHFDATVDGRPLMSMREGCAGFFTAEDLAAGKGIVKSRLEREVRQGRRAGDWRALVGMEVGQVLDGAQVDALRGGQLVRAFGSAFAGLPLRAPHTLPGGRMRLVHRVVEIDPGGGRFGLGRIVAQADISADDWFITCHFVDDPVMPGTLMYECCLHTLRIFLMRLGWLGETGEVVCEPVPGVRSRLKCRGQVLATTRVVTYEIEIKELGYDVDGVPFAIGDASMAADGHPIVDIVDMSLRMSGCTRLALETLWSSRARESVSAVVRSGTADVGPARKPAVYGPERIRAFAEGAPSAAFGPAYAPFDHRRRIARLPREPFSFIDRVTRVEGAPFELQAGASCEAQLDLDPAAWFFVDNRQRELPFAVLLEAGLQPCGWLAAYCGSALASSTDLKFRNLGGEATQHAAVVREEDTLTTQVVLTKVSRSAGMILQDFRFSMRSRRWGRIYEGNTNFGFFSAAALEGQVGLRGAKPWTADGPPDASPFAVPVEAPFPSKRWWMIDRIERIDWKGGAHGLGYIEGTARVDPSAWFFAAHFHQDPVWPGSLGLEAFLQLLKVFAVKRWEGVDPAEPDRVFSCVVAGNTHRWQYRGQVTPTCREVRVQASISAVESSGRLLIADGLLWVDGLPIYEIRDFALRLRGSGDP